jgi:hypothetical protein
MRTNFDEFVDIQIESQDNSATEVADKINEWKKQIEDLYSIVNKHLEDYIKDDKIKVMRESFTKHEQMLGSYDVERLNIIIGRQLVHLDPKGKFVIGAYGRVDMSGTNGIIRIVLVDEDLDGWGTIAASVLANKEKNNGTFGNKNGLKWKISTPPPRIRYYNLDKENFLDALMQVANG